MAKEQYERDIIAIREGKIKSKKRTEEQAHDDRKMLEMFKKKIEPTLSSATEKNTIPQPTFLTEEPQMLSQRKTISHSSNRAQTGKIFIVPKYDRDGERDTYEGNIRLPASAKGWKTKPPKSAGMFTTKASEGGLVSNRQLISARITGGFSHRTFGRTDESLKGDNDQQDQNYMRTTTSTNNYIRDLMNQKSKKA